MKRNSLIICLVLIIAILISCKIIGDNQKNKRAEYIKDIKDYVEEINPIDEIKVVDGTLSKEIYGEEIEEYIKDFGDDSVGAKIYTDREKYAVIIPNSDFLDNQYYYFKDNKLVAYMKEFCGIGGNIKYYFKDNKIVEQEENVEDEMDINIARENEQEIIRRSEKIRELYIQK